MDSYRVGAFVRVKRGVPLADADSDQGCPYAASVGRRLRVLDEQHPSCWIPVLQLPRDGIDYVAPYYLEPWNDAEEWNGTAWVAKAVLPQPGDPYPVADEMTLRDVFAVAAAQSELSRRYISEADTPTFAKGCYRFADAMLEARDGC